MDDFLNSTDYEWPKLAQEGRRPNGDLLLLRGDKGGQGCLVTPRESVISGEDRVNLLPHLDRGCIALDCHRM